jgi:16S rRNA (cytosine967-C5)-methyltransferase
MRRFLRERDALISPLSPTSPRRAGTIPSGGSTRCAPGPPAPLGVRAAGRPAPPPMTLRVNLRRGTVDDYQARLARAAGRGGRRIGPAALILDGPARSASCRGFEGEVSVQDLAAQLAAPLLGAQAGDAGARCLRRARRQDGPPARARRLPVWPWIPTPRASARARDPCADRPVGRGAPGRRGPGHPTGGTGKPYRRILLDAPCSASGIVRRHPDVRWLRRRSDIATMARRQSEMLAALWGVLEPGGTLLFATCSVFRAEGDQVVERFCARPGRCQAAGSSGDGRIRRTEQPHRSPAAAVGASPRSRRILLRIDPQTPVTARLCPGAGPDGDGLGGRAVAHPGARPPTPSRSRALASNSAAGWTAGCWWPISRCRCPAASKTPSIAV